MKPKQPKFPKQIFFRFVSGQLFLAVPALAATILFVREFFFKRNTELSGADLQVLDHALLSVGAFILVFFVLISLWMGYRLVFPLGRILMRARAIQSREYREEPEVEKEDTGEWSDLEVTLNRIEAKLQTQDVSLLKEQGELEAILTAISDAVIAVDKNGESLFFNSPFAVLFGPKGEVAPKRLTDFVRSPEVIAAFEAALRHGKRGKINALIPLRHDRINRHFSLSVAPIREPSGAIFGAVGVFHDVDELKRMEQIRIDFVANVSHELRTPLTAIKGYAQTLGEEITGKQLNIAEKAVAAVTRNTNRLIELVEDLLNLSSLESGTEIQKEKIDLKELTDRVIAQLEPRRAEKRQTIQTEFSAESLFADPRRVEQVLYNLLENAIKYVPNQKNIQVLWNRTERDVVLQVIDNGPGIPREHYPRLFERFYRVDSARARELGGTGLGLAIVKHVMLRHGGSVDVKNVATGGTEFVCRFPFPEEIH